MSGLLLPDRLSKVGHLDHDRGEVSFGAGGVLLAGCPQCCLARTNGLPNLVLTADRAGAGHNDEELIHCGRVATDLPTGRDAEHGAGNLFGPDERLRRNVTTLELRDGASLANPDDPHASTLQRASSAKRGAC